ncbi:TetR/AcrR family transcriptional regulator [Rugamonas sp. DEMB1]|uniref:TetR/AcrR family transcriptional regulator n=1 Tax=Rugamonas sp. DEMB1 TaxID=3039386 RepID=UPI00244739AA|nr:TetR/AcrR family transcriptional regulator [Rugamonas sp. DEMB1]WGG52851.1 TetR/AcrR family transcriptional regulator [Rugamonas sp. DEMB1]
MPPNTKPTQHRETKLPRTAWLESGLGLLSGTGPQAITVEQLCKSVGRSKGSFYHHFADVKTYGDALVSFWEQRDTESVMRMVDQSAGAWQKRQALAGLALSLDGSTERAMRQWAASNADVGGRVAVIDQRRIAYLAGLIDEINGHGDPADALDLARIEYATFVGLFYVLPCGQRVDSSRMLRRFLMLMTPAAPPLPPNWPDA